MPEAWPKFDYTDFDSFVTRLFHLVRCRVEVQERGVIVNAVNTPGFQRHDYLTLCLVSEWTSPQTAVVIMDPRGLAHTGIKQALAHALTQVSLLNILYRKRFHFYRQVTMMKITGVANKTM